MSFGKQSPELYKTAAQVWQRGVDQLHLTISGTGREIDKCMSLWLVILCGHSEYHDQQLKHFAKLYQTLCLTIIHACNHATNQCVKAHNFLICTCL